MNIKPLHLHKTDLLEMSAVMAVGNTALKECAEMLNMTHREFRGLVFRNKLNISSLPPEQAEKIKKAIPLIYSVKEKCEDKLLRGFVRWIAKQARMIASHATYYNDAFEDLNAEGMFALQDVIYSYTDCNIKLQTFVLCCVRRRILAAYNNLNPFCPLTNEAIKLRKMFEEKKATYDEYVNNQQVVEDMELDDNQKQILLRSMTQIINQGQIKNDSQSEGINDYTSVRRGIDNDFQENFSRDEVRQAVKNAKLTSVEIETYLTSLYPYWGWQENVASRYINPRTLKRYTKANIPHIKDRAEKKIKDAYLSPPEVNLQDVSVDKWFDEMSGQNVN